MAGMGDVQRAGANYAEIGFPQFIIAAFFVALLVAAVDRFNSKAAGMLAFLIIASVLILNSTKVLTFGNWLQNSFLKGGS